VKCHCSIIVALVVAMCIVAICQRKLVVCVEPKQEVMLMKFKTHYHKTLHCKKCQLWKTRNRIVVARGKIPADVLFIGEAPGASEDVGGLPFCGPAGRLLDHIIEQSIPDSVRYAITNLVCCIPKYEDASKTEPNKDSILACRDRLLEFIEMCCPKRIFCVGKLSTKYTPKFDKVSPAYFINLIHPAAILRMDVSQQSLAIKRSIVVVKTAIKALEG
jgi:uracil-DNA glycosylase family 4